MPERPFPEMAFAVARQSSEIAWGEPNLDENGNRWNIPLSVTIDRESKYIPKNTDWYCLLDCDYPFGDIQFLPSRTNGITATFNHQERNSHPSTPALWRMGKPCLTEPFGERSQIKTFDPVGDRDQRLYWYARRLVTWIRKAADNSLTLIGDPFELPQFPPAESINQSFSRIVFEEDSHSFEKWATAPIQGRLKYAVLPGIDKHLCALEFLSRDRTRKIHSWSGRHISPPQNESDGRCYWIKGNDIIVKPPWEAPETWGGLREAFRNQSIDLDPILKIIAQDSRDKPHGLLFCGSPIPLHFGEQPSEMHWFVLRLPHFTSSGQPPHGFRPNELGWWARDRRSILGDDSKLVYLKSENWSKKRLLARGHAPKVIGSKVALVGAGSLGSQISLSLARMGIDDFLLIDADQISAGNVTRHTAALSNVGQPKVEVLANQIKGINPYAQATSKANYLTNSNCPGLISDYPIVLDCSADSEVPWILSKQWYPIPKLWISVCVGYKAKRIYVYGARGHRFPAESFFQEIEKWLQEDRQRFPPELNIVEGPGCWHPLFPARNDDMCLAGAVCTKTISSMAEGKTELGLHVFEQQEDDVFSGLKRLLPLGFT